MTIQYMILLRSVGSGKRMVYNQNKFDYLKFRFLLKK